MTPRDLKEIGAQICLGNTFPLMVRPDWKPFRTRWTASLHGLGQAHLTDSGGFRSFHWVRCARLLKKRPSFLRRSTATKLFLTPEVSMQIQHTLNSDIVMIFDECTHFRRHTPKAISMRLSQRWARRSRDEHDACPTPMRCSHRPGRHYEDLRDESLAGLCDIGFDGMAIGGLSVGEPKTRWRASLLTPRRACRKQARAT